MSVTRGAPGRLALIVLGSHRSGTSATARVLSLAGATLPAKLMGPQPNNNETGFWEPQEVAEFDDHVLRQLDSSWDDVFGPRRNGDERSFGPDAVEDARAVVARNYGEADLIVLKEPRMTLVASLWKAALRAGGYQLAFVIPVRNPLEVAQSLKARDGFTRNRGLLLWTSYMLRAERETRGERRVFVTFEDLLADPEAALDRMERKLAFRFPRRTWESAAEIEEFLRADLKTEAKSPISALAGPLTPIRRLYEHLQAAAEDAPENEDVTAEVADWFGALEQTVAPVLKQQERDAKRSREAADAKLRDIENASDELARQAESARAELELARSDGVELTRALAAVREEAERVVEAGIAERDAVHVRATELEAALERQQDAMAAQMSARRGAESEHGVHLDAARAELAALRSQGDELERQLASARDQLTQVERDRADEGAGADARMSALEVELASKEEVLNTLHAQLGVAQTAEREAETRVLEAQQALSRMREELDEARRSAEAELEVLTQEFAEAAERARGDHDALSAELVVSAGEAERLRAELGRVSVDLETRISDAGAAEASLLAQRDAARREVATRQAELEDARTAAKAELDALTKELAEAAERARDDHDAQSAELVASVGEADRLRAELGRVSVDLETRISDAGAAEASLLAERDAARREVATRQAELEDARTAAKAELDALTKELAEAAERARDDHDAQSAELVASVGEKERLRSELHRMSRDLKTRISDAEQTAASLRVERDAARREVARHQEELTQTVAEGESRAAEWRAALSTARSTARADLEAEQARTTKAAVSLDDARRELDRLNGALSSAGGEVSELTSANEKLLEEHARLADAVGAAERARDEAVRTADERTTLVESALRIARRRTAETEEVLQQRITAGQTELREVRLSLAAAGEALHEERSARTRAQETHAVALRSQAEEVRRISSAALDQERRCYADEDAALRERLAEVGLAATTAQTRVRELQGQLDAANVELDSRRGWFAKLFGRG